ncbi:hypothetical protein [Novosphingopyxis sp. YJ-S2-01]|uniref:hypothetical protein n=1 Tax=Novosphingopyxis sp. YJ-S2-01 TaxID=2794021 RepID=UPI0018DD6F6B|nr:hypothetical protein [Novosphingopyxis sp. YJ-S2-01]MBH9538613.1 hypothetical protein [Novosphingopyxis sp. YJ-S2-01]
MTIKIAFAASAIAMAWGAPVVAQASSLADAQTVLADRSECTTFSWLPNPNGDERGAITVPVSVNGETLNLQLDTGANATILYGSKSEDAGWTSPDAESFRTHQFSIGSTAVDRPAIYLDRNMTAGDEVAGTLGLAELVGRVSVIDYPGRRFCLFADADLPDVLRDIPGVRGTLRNGKLFVPVKVGDVASDAMVFDTGSSELPLWVDLELWQKLTGLDNTTSAPRTFEGSSWGTKITLSGASTKSPVMLGAIALGPQNVFTNAAKPDSFKSWPFRADGVLGNAPLWDGMLVLDLTGRVRLGFTR